MPALFANGKYGQVEPNRLSGITYGVIEAQAPAYQDKAAQTPIAELENGMFLCVLSDVSGTSPMGRIAVLPGVAEATSEPFMVFSERKQYDEREVYSDFVDRAKDKIDGLLYPRLISMKPDTDVFTTNTIYAPVTTTFTVGQKLYIGNDGYLTTTPGKNLQLQFEVSKVYTLPDGQPAVKLLVQHYVEP